MALDIMKERGISLLRQKFDWRDMVRTPISKLDDDAFTRVRIILMNGVELEAVRFQHSCACMNGDLRRALAEVRRAEQHQATLVNWLLPADQSPLETTIAYEQVAIEVTASLAQHEPDPYIAQVLRFGLLEDFRHTVRQPEPGLGGFDCIPRAAQQPRIAIGDGGGRLLLRPRDGARREGGQGQRPEGSECSMRTETTSMGLNRTGIGTSPGGNGAGLASLREAYENEAEPIGTVPIPTTLKGAFRAGVDLVKGRGTAVFLDKLGERLAFERTGTRLYEALLTKLDTSPGWDGGPTRAELARFHDEELTHFALLRDCMEEIGADPTAETPSADVVGVASMGLIQVVTDPRTTLPQSLNALLTAELTDNDGWQMLIDVARAVGQDELAARFQRAQEEEVIHLAAVRRWLAAEASIEAKGDAGQKPA